jgi:uncharacterized protein HemX
LSPVALAKGEGESSIKLNEGIMKNLRNIAIAVVIVLAAGFGIYYTKNVKSTTNTTATAQVQQTTITYQGEDGKTAFELLKSKYQVESTDSSFGVMVNAISGLKSSDKEFWLYSVNGTSPDVGADKYVTKSTDQVQWDYKAI